MSPREKKLALAVAGVIVFWCATQGLTKYRYALAETRAKQTASEQALNAARIEINSGKKAKQDNRNWQKQSLPTNPDIAKSLYHDWLRQQLSQAGLQIKDLNSKLSSMAQSKYYKQLTFTIEAEGKLDDLTKFLHGFYKSGHLHRISKATLTPTEERKKLAASLTVDALSLTDCSRTDQLTDIASNLRLPTKDELQEKILSRNIFAVYHPPTPPQAETTASAQPDQEAAQAFITSITKGLQGWRMTILMRESGNVLFFNEGDEISIGQFQGKIDKLDGRKVIVSTDSERLQIRLGENLKQAQPAG